MSARGDCLRGGGRARGCGGNRGYDGSARGFSGGRGGTDGRGSSWGCGGNGVRGHGGPPAGFQLAFDASVRLEMLHEDDHVLGIMKPAGVLAHPSPGFWDRGTVAHALVGKLPEEMLEERGNHNEWDSFIPRCVVHRLDAGTSGVMVIAKSPLAERRLTEAMRTADAPNSSASIAAASGGAKVYVALLLGHPGGTKRETCVTVTGPIGRDTENQRRWAVVASGKPARTVIRVHAFDDSRGLTLATAELFSGRTHQIRVHCASVGAPVAGDDLYAPRAANAEFKRCVASKLPAKRQLLHAWALDLPHPAIVEESRSLRVRAPLPSDLWEVVGKVWPELGPDPSRWPGVPGRLADPVSTGNGASKERQKEQEEISSITAKASSETQDKTTHSSSADLTTLELRWLSWWESSSEGLAWEKERLQWEAQSKRESRKRKDHPSM
eukprot:TRINITY_DN37751_c0_g2_i1.p1 TRINITY_DN37751_c0_g2~~TRINITY_DN37751_c0_g2_i1.p1  ORF type:complete len:439 (-),score=60.24 TRINITY_DN37751_c0_g2_i1:40-1356(-)